MASELSGVGVRFSHGSAAAGQIEVERVVLSPLGGVVATDEIMLDQGTHLTAVAQQQLAAARRPPPARPRQRGDGRFFSRWRAQRGSRQDDENSRRQKAA